MTTSKSNCLTIVIGIGNEYRGDDGVGPFIARKIEQENLPNTLVKVQRGEGLSLMQSWGNAHKAIILDSAGPGDHPGKIYRFCAHEKPIPARSLNCSTHNFGIVEAIELARTWNILPPRVIVYGIVGKSFDAGTGLSSEVREAAGTVVDNVIKEIRERMQR